MSIASTAMEALSCMGVNHADDGGSGAGLLQQHRRVVGIMSMMVTVMGLP